jgi:hypothetical protein
LAPDRHLTRLFLQRFIENDLISPDADRGQVLAQACAAIITGGLFVSILLSLPYLTSLYPMPSRTSVNVIRVQFLYAAWSMTVMALVAVSVWDALALDSRDTEILGPLPLARGVIVRAKVSALVMFSAGFAAALNVVPAMIHPVLAVTPLRPSTLQVATLIAAHITSTTAAAALGFVAVLGLRELLHAIVGTTGFRRISVVVRVGLVVALVTTLLLIPAMSFKVANLWLHGAIKTNLLPPMWFAGLHDMMSGHIWAQLPRPDLPPSLAVSERAFAFMYQSRRPLLHQLGLTGGGTFLVVLLASAAAYLWNNRRLPDPPISRTAERGLMSAIFDAIAQRLVARRPLVRAGFFFTMRVLARSVQNRISIGIPLAVAIAVATVSLRVAGMSSSFDFSSAPIALLAVQLLFVTALVAGFRHSVRVPADLHARWLFHLIRPANHSAYMAGVKRAAVVKLVVPALLALLPLHVLALGRQTAILHFTYGLLSALVLVEGFLLGYRRLPFASSYVPAATITTYAGIYAFIVLVSVYTVAWLEHLALSTTLGTVVLFVATGTILAMIRGIDMWQRRERVEVELDEVIDPPTLRLGLME